MMKIYFTKSFAHFNILSFISPFLISSNIWRYKTLFIEKFVNNFGDKFCKKKKKIRERTNLYHPL